MYEPKWRLHPSSGERCLHCKRMILFDPSGPGILLLRTHPEEPKAPSRRILCTALFMAALLTRARTRSTPSAHGPTKGCRRSCVHTAACCSALRRKGMLTHAAPCVYLTDVLLSKVSFSAKENLEWLHLSIVRGTWSGQMPRDRKW